MAAISRRDCLIGTAFAAIASPTFAMASSKPYRVGVIGHTGRGDYGHGLHTMWLGIPEAKVVAIADAESTGLNATLKHFVGADGFADYRKMLDESKPDIVAIGMRHVDQHRDVALAAIEANVRGIYIEKPFCRSPQEADEIISATRSKNVKVSIAHRNRFHPVLPVVKRLIQDGGIGRVLEYRMRGKEDARGGMLDLWVLGSHLFNLVCYFAGAPKACSASVILDGRPAKKSDAIPGAEGIGLMAGNEVHARFEMDNGLAAYFDSIAKAGNPAAGFGLQIIGTEGVVDFRIDREPLAHIRSGSPFQPTSDPNAWIPISTAGIGKPEPIAKLGDQIAKHWLPGQELIQSIEQDRTPLCNEVEASATIEMITAVSCSHLQQGARIELSQISRSNPWG
jgi:predicted dehydrogenase